MRTSEQRDYQSRAGFHPAPHTNLHASRWVCVLLVLCLSPLLQAQQMRSATWSTDKFLMRYRTMLEPARAGSPELNIGGGGVDDATTNHRVLMDSHEKKYFGYDLSVDPTTPGHFNVTIKALTLTAANLRFFGIDGSWSQISLPSTPGTVQVSDGETMAFDLMINPSTGQKIVEYVTVSSPARGAVSVARDLQFGDIQMSLNSPRLRINGKSQEWNGGDAHGEANGPVLWIYIQDRGRFLLSFTPRGGYVRAGDVSGKKMKFTWNGDVYEFETQGKILPSEGVWNLYVSQDAGYRPAGYPPALYGGVSLP